MYMNEAFDSIFLKEVSYPKVQGSYIFVFANTPIIPIKPVFHR